jgi:hypothetical protein
MWHALRRGGERCLRGFGWEVQIRRWEDNMKMHLREIRDQWGELDWAGLG